jgi:two-component system sensor histidine kinase RpfC
MDTSEQLPVIMLTADATPEAKETSMSAGANRFLTKPIDARGLLECIASLSKNTRKGKLQTTVLPQPIRHLHSNFVESEWYDNVILHELDLLGEDPDFVKTLLLNFEKEGSRHILNIKKAMQDDYLDYRENLHALKGSATELGATKLVDICLEGEALKPFDMGSEKINQTCMRVEEIFKLTVTALNNAVTFDQNFYQKKITDS